MNEEKTSIEFSNSYQKDNGSKSMVYSTSTVQTTKKKIGIGSLVALTFYSVSGGPFGIEDIVKAGGPLYALLGFSLMLIWSLPEALITAELSTALPESSGSVAWVEVAFGSFWAFQKGYLSWLSGVADNALYPILFLDCILQLFSKCHNEEDSYLSSSTCYEIQELTDEKNFFRLIIIFIITLILTFSFAWRGLEIVSSMSILVCIFSLLPFIIFCIKGSFHVVPSRWLIQPDSGIAGVNWRLLLNTFFWNINYWETASSFAADVENPGKTYPLGMVLSVILVFFALFFPVLIATGASTSNYTEWTDGYFISLGYEIGGKYLSYWLICGAAATNIGMFCAEMSSDAWQIAGMADRGLLPKVLGNRNKYDAPTYGVLLSASGILCLCWMSFTEVIEMLNLLYCFGQLIEFAAFLHLRYYKPDMLRPYKIGLDFFGMCCLLAFPTIFIFIIMWFSSLLSLVVCGCLALSGIALYYVLESAKYEKWCEFEESYDKIDSSLDSLIPS